VGERIAVFVVVFLEIHPFEEGNGRLSRAHGTCNQEHAEHRCRPSIIEKAVSLIRPKTFVYLLTLGTHFPIIKSESEETRSAECIAQQESVEVCDHIRNTTKVLVTLAEVIRSSAGVTPLVVVIGDHPPPFTRATSRQAFLFRRVPAT